MASSGADATGGTGTRWPARAPVPRRPHPAPLFGYLFDLDDDLAEEVEIRMRVSARQHVTARLLDAETGACDLDSWFASVGRGPGLLIVDGLLAVDTRVADRTITELLGPGDLLQPPGAHEDELVERETLWRALHPSRLALLDSDFVERVRSWPQILNALFRRAERRSDDLDMIRAISSQPRLEVRLVLLLWHLAARWGRVEPAGLRLSLPLTHRLLGQLVAAERPSISHALRRLSQAGIVTGAAGDWHLHGSVETHLESLIERTARLTPHDQAASSTRRRIA
ncbi:MAG: Crp/Fnr family transcriptional regulator [Solirubrobacterales bacterium]|nr:Crp/Fnr family transcriptional regulator [Solirubrobacterales bacterium]